MFKGRLFKIIDKAEVESSDDGGEEVCRAEKNGRPTTR